VAGIDYVIYTYRILKKKFFEKYTLGGRRKRWK
jgi:hypothetical protein